VSEETKFLCYNIDGFKNKVSDVFFINFVRSFDLFFLIETHLECFNNPNLLSDFKTFVLPATRESKFGRASGGIICGVKLNCELVKHLDFAILNNTMCVTIKPFGNVHEAIC